MLCIFFLGRAKKGIIKKCFAFFLWNQKPFQFFKVRETKFFAWFSYPTAKIRAKKNDQVVAIPPNK
jgi:hypothetical protein